MYRIVFILVLVTVGYLPATINAQGDYLNKGVSGIQFGAGYSSNKNVSGYEVNLGYSHEGVLDFGLGVGKYAQDSENKFTNSSQIALAPYAIIHLLKEDSTFLPMTLSAGVTFYYYSEETTRMTALDGSLVGYHGWLSRNFRISPNVCLQPNIGFSVITAYASSEGYILVSSSGLSFFHKTGEDSDLRVELATSVVDDVVSVSLGIGFVFSNL